MNRPDCKHPSAFCLMMYRTPDRNAEEVVWNSRDMDVPDEIPRGKLKLTHADAHRDEFKPFFVPRIGTRIWANPVLDRAEKSAEEFYVEHNAEKDFIAQFGEDRRTAVAKIVETQLRKLAEEDIKPAPVLVPVTAEVAARIQAALEKRGHR